MPIFFYTQIGSVLLNNGFEVSAEQRPKIGANIFLKGFYFATNPEAIAYADLQLKSPLFFARIDQVTTTATVLNQMNAQGFVAPDITAQNILQYRYLNRAINDIDELFLLYPRSIGYPTLSI
jgi:hypothetical protein